MGCAISVNIPFVTGRCDFYGRNLYTNTAPAIKHAYLDALIAEARSVGEDLGEPVSCVAFEGGALGTIEPQKLREFLSELASALPLADDCFVSAEVDPGLLSTATMDELLAFGISALRFHCLTSNPIESEWLERAGAVGEMAKSRIVLESAGFSNIDAQILVGFAGQTEKTLLKTLRELVLMSDVSHCTLLAARGSMSGDAAFAAEMFCVASAFLEEHGFAQYAPLCFAKPGFELPIERVRKSGDVVGLGPSTVSRLGNLMWANSGDIDAYIQSDADPEAVTESVIEITGALASAQKEIAHLWQLGSTSLSADFGDLVCDGRLTAQGCLDFDEVARRVVAEFIE